MKFLRNNLSLKNSIVDESNKITNTFINWSIEIVNAYSKNFFGVILTNAIAESNNNYILKLIDTGYGYTNFNRLENVFYTCLPI